MYLEGISTYHVLVAKDGSVFENSTHILVQPTVETDGVDVVHTRICSDVRAHDCWGWSEELKGTPWLSLGKHNLPVH